MESTKEATPTAIEPVVADQSVMIVTGSCFLMPKMPKMPFYRFTTVVLVLEPLIEVVSRQTT